MDAIFTINKQQFKVNSANVPIDTTLNTFIRTHAKLTGTKFMCLEGGCGACIVTLTGRHPASGEEKSWAVNSCLWFVYSCHGLKVTTVEGIGNKKIGYHPVQTALHEFNGTQCGYCSPGMVMNMYSLMEANDGKVSAADVENSFGGNICRCTGYRPILDAFKSLSSSAATNDIEDLSVNKCCKPNLQGRLCSGICGQRENPLSIVFADGRQWITVQTLQALLDVLSSEVADQRYILVSGDTAHGVYRRPDDLQVFIDINQVPELHQHSISNDGLVIGANVSLTETMAILIDASKSHSGFKYCEDIAKHIDLVANVPVRNTGSIAGNLSIKHGHKEFPSDIYLLLETVGAKLTIVAADGSSTQATPLEYRDIEMKKKVITNIVLPILSPDKFVFRSYKVMPRAQNTHAYVNAGFLFEFNNNNANRTVASCRICYGGINTDFTHAKQTEKLLAGSSDLYTNEGLQKVISSLLIEIQPDWILPDAAPDYRRNLAIALFYRFVLNTIPNIEKLNSEYKSGADSLLRGLSSGSQSYGTNEKEWPLTKPVHKYDGRIQCSGEAQYANDMFSINEKDAKWAAFVVATKVHSKIIKIDATDALKIPGVCFFFSAADIPGKNSFTPTKMFGMVEDEPIFIGLNSEVLFYGQPCGMILAENMQVANMVAKKVKISYEKMEKNIAPTLQDWLKDNEQSPFATSSGKLNDQPMSNDLKATEHVKGRLEIGSQYHYTMEAQTTFCIPADDGGIDVYTSTQWVDFSQMAIAAALKIPENSINMIVKRVGGAYGAKISRSAQIACACALACNITRQPVRFVLTIESNMTSVGKRYALVSEYDIGIDKHTGTIQQLNASFVEDFGCSPNEDVTPFTKLMIRNCYANAENWKVKSEIALTDAPSASWCRAPGTTEGIAIIEIIMEHIARKIEKDPADVRLANIANDNKVKEIFSSFLTGIDYRQRKADIDKFNMENRWRKRGLAVTAMEYPLEYFGSNIAYVAINHGDGTVIVSHGGIECGQGINTKVAQVTAHALGIPLEMVNVKPTNNLIGCNAFVTGGSMTSEAICFAILKCCEQLLQRMQPVRDSMPPNTSWQDLAQASYERLIDLTEKYMFKGTDLKSYLIYGCAGAEVEVDLLTGNILIQRVDIVEDTGNSMSPLVDVGQVEGAFIMGVGYWLAEELVYDRKTGELLTNRTWNYKPPGAKDIPIDFRISFLKNSPNEGAGVLRSKATGEPALCMSIVVLFALRHALDSARKDNGIKEPWYSMGSATTPEKVFLLSENNVENFKLN